jgi:hypothetical protein
LGVELFFLPLLEVALAALVAAAESLFLFGGVFFFVLGGACFIEDFFVFVFWLLEAHLFAPPLESFAGWSVISV